MPDQYVPDQADGGATIVEIGQQPDAWREVAAAVGPTADEFLAPLLQRSGTTHHPDRRRQFGVHR